jgi:transposase
MDKRWAQAPGRRDQLLLYGESLDDAVPQGHAVRVLEDCLALVDWGPWEARYAGRRGQPPLHPRLLAGSMLYGLMRGIRSSRELEDATRERVDFMWFLERRTIDHSTFAEFRAQFAAELKGLHAQIGRLVCERYEEALLALVIDGTRIRANSDRHGARTAEGLERLVGACVRELDRRLARLAEQDEQGAGAEDVAELRREIEQLQAKVARYEKALEVARSRDARKQESEGSGAHAVRVPVTDPDAQIVPNKEGGFAPNFTPTVAVDPASRLIVAGDVLDGSEESTAVLPAVEAAQSLGAVKPERVLADTGFASGENLESLEAQGIEAYMPTNTDFSERNPANRPDPSQPVPEDQWAQLPKRGQQLASAAFVYDAARDQYICPMGRELTRVRNAKRHRSGISVVQYQCAGKAGCPLAGQCVKERAAARMITRDQYQDVRDRVGQRMATPAGHAIYQKRAPVVEGVFAEIKHAMGIRRFLLRGLEKARTEWAWICIAFNLKRLMRLTAPQAQRPKRAYETMTARSPVICPGLLQTLQEALFLGPKRPHPAFWKPSRWRINHLSHQILKQTG